MLLNGKDSHYIFFDYMTSSSNLRVLSIQSYVSYGYVGNKVAEPIFFLNDVPADFINVVQCLLLSAWLSTTAIITTY